MIINTQFHIKKSFASSMFYPYEKYRWVIANSYVFPPNRIEFNLIHKK